LKKKGISLSYIFNTYNLLIILAGVIIVFSILLPNSFPTLYNLKSILNYQAIVVLLAIAVTIPIAAGHFDLSAGYSSCLLHILTVGLICQQGLPWPVVIVIILACGALIGLINGILITRIGIHSFIATLGVGYVVYGIAYWYTDGKQVLGSGLPQAFLSINSTWGIIPTTFIITMIIAVIVYICMEFLPAGRCLYFLGSNEKAANLTGISSKKYMLLAFVCSGVIVAMASIMMASVFRVGQTSVGPNYLMNSFAGALMSSVAFKSGKSNVWGTVCSVLLMATVVSGLQQMGAAYFVEPLLQGLMLIVAVSWAVITKRNRATKIKDEKNAEIRKGRENA